MEGFTPFSAIVGGALIGLSASLLWIANGHYGNVSGIVGGVVAPLGSDVTWRGTFLVGVTVMGVFAFQERYRMAGAWANP